MNKAPVVFHKMSQQVFKGQKWKYIIDSTVVKDPESQPMKFEFVGDSPSGMKISSVGVITWFPQDVNQTYEVTIKATDPCGKSASAQLVVKTVPCYCEGNNGGYCFWNNSTPKCKCPDGCLEPT